MAFFGIFSGYFRPPQYHNFLIRKQETFIKVWQLMEVNERIFVLQVLLLQKYWYVLRQKYEQILPQFSWIVQRFRQENGQQKVKVGVKLTEHGHSHKKLCVQLSLGPMLPCRVLIFFFTFFQKFSKNKICLADNVKRNKVQNVLRSITY